MCCIKNRTYKGVTQEELHKSTTVKCEKISTTKKYLTMNWYLAKIVYRIVCGDGNHTPQFDEQLRLIQASDELHAFQKARRLGEREQDHFLKCMQFI